MHGGPTGCVAPRGGGGDDWRAYRLEERCCARRNRKRKVAANAARMRPGSRAPQATRRPNMRVVSMAADARVDGNRPFVGPSRTRTGDERVDTIDERRPRSRSSPNSYRFDSGAMSDAASVGSSAATRGGLLAGPDDLLAPGPDADQHDRHADGLAMNRR